mmetsp:Transcript_23623/g.41911  ORF Transcript_23623/g.41911 Transcript_23623/m.41911 type:complete len:234 (-) Transcript_23623:874-1575(-)
MRKRVKARAMRAAAAVRAEAMSTPKAARAKANRTGPVSKAARVNSKVRTKAAKAMHRAKDPLPTGSRRCATNCAASRAACPALARPRVMPPVMRLTVRAAPWTGPKKHCANATLQKPSTTSRRRWRPCAKACAPWAKRCSKNSRQASRAKACPKPTVAPKPKTRWAVIRVQMAASAPTRGCCRAKMSIAAPATCWTKSAAALATVNVQMSSWIISNGCSTGSDQKTLAQSGGR